MLKALVLLLAISSVLPADFVTLGSSQDAAVANCALGQPWCDMTLGTETPEHLMINPTGATDSQGLIQFDLSALTGASVSNATLSLYHVFNPQPAGTVLALYRNTSDWIESTVTFNTKPTFDPVAVAGTSIAGPQGDFHTWDLTSVVQGWADGSYANYGLTLIVSPNMAPWPYFASKEFGVEAQRPALAVTYDTVPEPGYFALLGGVLGALFLVRRRRA